MEVDKSRENERGLYKISIDTSRESFKNNLNKIFKNHMKLRGHLTYSKIYNERSTINFGTISVDN